MPNGEVYYAEYKGVQLGDEMTAIAASIDFGSATVTRFFQSAIAAVHRDTVGKVYRYELATLIVAADLIAAMQQVRQYEALANTAAGDLVVYQDPDAPNERDRIEDVYLDPAIASTPGEDPSLGRILTVRFNFVTNLRGG